MKSDRSESAASGDWRVHNWLSLADERPDLASFCHVMAATEVEGPRGQVLTLAAFLEDVLGQALRAFLCEGGDAADMLDRGGLSSLSSRIAACAALGLITARERDECHRVRKIRNRFAHDHAVDFDDPGVADLCAALAMKVPGSDGRGAFSSSAAPLVMQLSHRHHYVRRTSTINFDQPN